MSTEYTNEQLTELYEKTYKSVYAVAYSIVKNEQDALDLTQDTYIAAFEKIESLSDQAKFDKWVIQIAANKCKDFLRKKKPTLFSQMDTEDTEFEEEIVDSSDSFNPDAVLDKNQTAEVVKEILYTLPEDQRLCVVLFYGQELKISEIADSLGVSENTVKSRLNYGKKKIKQEVEALEKKGTKLYGISIFAILPLIRFLFGSQTVIEAPVTIAQGTSMVSAVLGKVNAAANVTATVTEAANASATFARITHAVWSLITKNLASKIISIALAAAVIGTSAAVIITPKASEPTNDKPLAIEKIPRDYVEHTLCIHTHTYAPIENNSEAHEIVDECTSEECLQKKYNISNIGPKIAMFHNASKNEPCICGYNGSEHLSEGKTVICEHEAFVYQYDTNPSQHMIIVTCKTQLMFKGSSDTVAKISQDHTFVDGKCSVCGFSGQGESTVTSSESTVTSSESTVTSSDNTAAPSGPVMAPKDTCYHYNVRYGYKDATHHADTTCCDVCGLNEIIDGSLEEHTFVDGICSACKYEQVNES